jgi:hypothetical protein
VKTPRSLSASLCLSVALSVLSIASPASALSAKDEADRLFKEAIALRDKDDIVQACQKFEESQALDPSSGTLLNIGQCNETFGRWASAMAAFQEAELIAKKRNKAEHAKKAADRMKAIESKVPHLVLDRSAAPGATVLIDGKPQAGDRIAVDPGQHVVEAEAPNSEKYVSRTTAEASKDVSVKIPALTPKDGPKAGSDAPSTKTPMKGSDMVDKPSAKGMSMVPGIVVSSLGVAGIGAGFAFGGIASSALSDAKAACTTYPNVCSPDAKDPNDRAKTFSTVSTISLIAGGVLLAGGITLIVISALGGKAEVKTSLAGPYLSFERRF